MMMSDDYPAPFDLKQEFQEIKDHIEDFNLHGAAITILIDDVQEHYEVASRYKWKHSKRHYRDLLAKLIKNYGH